MLRLQNVEYVKSKMFTGIYLFTETVQEAQENKNIVTENSVDVPRAVPTSYFASSFVPDRA